MKNIAEKRKGVASILNYFYRYAGKKKPWWKMVYEATFFTGHTIIHFKAVEFACAGRVAGMLARL